MAFSSSWSIFHNAVCRQFADHLRVVFLSGGDVRRPNGTQQFAPPKRVQQQAGAPCGVRVEDNADQLGGADASRLRAANSRTALICSRVTGNCSTTSSMVMPSSRLS